MKKILIIEDNAPKLQDLKSFCHDNIQSCELSDRQSYNSAQQEVIFHGSEYDLILLDVSMNTYDTKKDDNGEQEPLAGSNILRFMKLRHIKTPVIVVTMYESFVDGVRINALDKRFKSQYEDIYKGFVYYNLKNEDWKEELLEKINNILK
ncbi:response regulator [Bacteroides acidifaciens]|jgi:CheY-like chemotaxis protein|uniref:response regulator n=1 Tax=Bacteroides acidifaciens TaxID=85831 RepID=UPI0027153499|nr:response regulator [Bacteroides acidifaciens]